ncbi:DNA polymerase subunit Cdc27 [Copromyces sp. CBS 386.78]|nr:DNA polymerase subunit Cdc27 [Copromyces sp. CBS 386.78]
MEDYKTYLAENVLSEDKVVTYRLLSRALRVHPNVAKQMLYDFHKTQSTKKPGSVYATYLLYGIKKSIHHQNGNAMDIDLPSSLPDADPVDDDEVPSYTLALIQEDRLADVLKDYETISSIHVYSVGPHPAKDLTLLVDAAQSALAIKDDAKKPRPRTIVNSHVRRRERRGPGLKAAAAAPVKQESKAKAAPTKTAPAKPSPVPAPAAAPPKTKKETKSATPAAEPEAPAAAAAAAAATKKPAPSLKRNTSAASGIMQAFSKAASLPKKAKTSAKSTPAAEDTPVVLSDDGEDDDDDVLLPKPGASSSRKSRNEREEELRRMMEEDEDEDMEEKADSPAPEEEEEEPAVEEPPAKTEAAKEEDKEIVTTTGDGRRRGRRRVMKKKQIMDDQGYLVTIQESAWESFSEDEAPPASKPKPKVASSAPSAVAGKGKKAAPKGQGNIMSFFSKK